MPGRDVTASALQVLGLAPVVLGARELDQLGVFEDADKVPRAHVEGASGFDLPASPSTKR